MCPDCTDPNGEVCYPQYGVAPHTHLVGKIFESTVILPESEWPDTFIPDPDNPKLGTWICPTCREMPTEETENG